MTTITQNITITINSGAQYIANACQHAEKKNKKTKSTCTGPRQKCRRQHQMKTKGRVGIYKGVVQGSMERWTAERPGQGNKQQITNNKNGMCGLQEKDSQAHWEAVAAFPGGATGASSTQNTVGAKDWKHR